MGKYRKKPVVIEAWKFNEKTFSNDIPGIQDRAMLSEMWSNKTAEDGRYYIHTLEGEMTVRDGDYIIKGISGEFYPCKTDIFAATYEKVED
ncbi:hypothetical protein [Halalkalibacter oceani]|uniref:hypothetical protein n=1 Tax=Halalkalibacter oceani TaxID=1653776 RepID=UPI00339A533C